jgi:hypothetical protein
MDANTVTKQKAKSISQFRKNLPLYVIALILVATIAALFFVLLS